MLDLNSSMVREQIEMKEEYVRLKQQLAAKQEEAQQILKKCKDEYEVRNKDYQKIILQNDEEFEKFKALITIENQVQQSIIDKQGIKISELEEEMKKVKAILRIPKLAAKYYQKFREYENQDKKNLLHELYKDKNKYESESASIGIMSPKTSGIQTGRISVSGERNWLELKDPKLRSLQTQGGQRDGKRGRYNNGIQYSQNVRMEQKQLFFHERGIKDLSIDLVNLRSSGTPYSLAHTSIQTEKHLRGPIVTVKKASKLAVDDFTSGVLSQTNKNYIQELDQTESIQYRNETDQNKGFNELMKSYFSNLKQSGVFSEAFSPEKKRLKTQSNGERVNYSSRLMQERIKQEKEQLRKYMFTTHSVNKSMVVHPMYLDK